MQWDYMTIEHKLDLDEMNRLGAEGWELVAVVSPAHFVLHYFFKRQAAQGEVGLHSSSAS